MSWNGPSPSWRVVPLGQVCAQKTLTDPRKQHDQSFRYVDVSSVSNESYVIIGAREILGKDAPSRARQVIQRDDVLFATVRPALKRVAMVPAPLDGQVCSTGYCVVRADREKLEPAYAYFYLLTGHVAEAVVSLQKGATYPAINDSDLFGLSIPLPPLPEQRAIVRALQAVKETKEARRREASMERERKAALLHHLFTHGTRGESRKQTEIGEMPESWSVVQIGDVAATLGSGVTPRGGEKSYVADGITLIRSQNVQMNRLDMTEVALITADTHEEMSRSTVMPGDVLLNITGASIGRVAFVPESLKVANVNQHVCRIRLREDTSPVYVSYYLSSPKGQSQIMGSQFGTTRQGLNYGNVRMLRLPFPSFDEQQTIAETLIACDHMIGTLEGEMAVLDELFRAMLEELMTARLSAVPLIEPESNA